MYATHPDMAKDWEKETPKGTKLPKKVKHAFALGMADAYDLFGLKTASQEIRLQIPRREFHGFEAAFKDEADRGRKQADEANSPLEPQANGNVPAETLADMLQKIDMPGASSLQDAMRDPLERDTMWSGASNPSAGDDGQPRE